ncbi:unnamed protein product [marine sediment metagenome]|uniref:Uncharacterized protein n=1 Tax=marine sediment metagenome TaxID=412755 RepID=X1I4W8_9ZZZZ
MADVSASVTTRFTPYTLALGLVHRYTGLSLLTVTALAADLRAFPPPFTPGCRNTP